MNIKPKLVGSRFRVQMLQLIDTAYNLNQYQHYCHTLVGKTDSNQTKTQYLIIGAVWGYSTLNAEL